MIRRRVLTGFLTFCLLFQSASITGLAADEAGTEQKTEPYTYSITFYAGNQGAFAGTEGITVVESGAPGGGKVEKSMRGDCARAAMTTIQWLPLPLWWSRIRIMWWHTESRGRWSPM